MFTNNTIIVNKYYYDKSNCKFILCDSCWWFATLLKDVPKISKCPKCKKKNRLHIDRITIF
jgi:CO dehydrogenase/acetyl-CoA synthase gamma subunit (corrinoid Fe-S protein)